jgi:motility quorum-sensing regulator / GCU-specific mRNA interferase toxin
MRSTLTVLSGAQMGLGFDDISGVVAALTMADFYKSMTACSDHRVWHDVYRPMTEAGRV